ncbi:MAG: hypothetical protein V4700_03570 [Pseudomonadota bacterium]
MEQVNFFSLSNENRIQINVKKLVCVSKNLIKLINRFKSYIFKFILTIIAKIIRFIFYSRLIKLIPIKIKLKIKYKLLLNPKFFRTLNFLRSYLKNPIDDKPFEYFFIFLISKIYLPTLDLVLNKIICKEIILNQIKKRSDLQVNFQKILFNKKNIYNSSNVLFSYELRNNLPININEVYSKLKKEIYYQSANYKL